LKDVCYPALPFFEWKQGCGIAQPNHIEVTQMKATANETPWQLKMFDKTLKKKLRLNALRKHIGDVTPDAKCLLVTCGDNNGAINYHLRALGGVWSWADYEDKSITEMSALLGEPVHFIGDGRLPFDDQSFDVVVTIDVHEHLPDMNPFTQELVRVAKPGGKVVVTVPNGDETKVATRIKNKVGMTLEKYGHYREGLTPRQLHDLFEANGIQPRDQSTFSRFFTEMLELSINFLYVNLLSRKSKTKVSSGTIAPATSAQLKSVNKSYRMYSMIYPVVLLLSKFDLLMFNSEGYVVMVEGKKA
jgi:SAM-dependent methyltransferase